MEREEMMQRKKLAKPPTLPELMVEMTSLNTHAAAFLNISKLLDIQLTLLVGTATVECSFSQMKMVKTRLCSRLNDVNFERLMTTSAKLLVLVLVLSLGLHRNFDSIACLVANQAWLALKLESSSC